MYNKNSLLKVYLYFKWIVIEYARALKNRRVRCWKTFTKMCLPANIYLFKVKYRNIKKRWETCSKLIINTANIYLFKVNNRNTRKRLEICLKLVIKTPERHYWRRSGVFIVNFKHISHLFLVSPLLTLNKQMLTGLRNSLLETGAISEI